MDDYDAEAIYRFVRAELDPPWTTAALIGDIGHVLEVPNCEALLARIVEADPSSVLEKRIDELFRITERYDEIEADLATVELLPTEPLTGLHVTPTGDGVDLILLSASPWTIPARLGLATSEDAFERLVFFRSWETRFGLQLAGLDIGTAVFVVDQPLGLEAARVVIREMVYLCDEVGSGQDDSLAQVASSAAVSTVFRMWWD